MRSFAKHLVPQNERQFRLYDHIDSDNWNDYIMQREKVTMYDDKLHFRDTGVVFSLKRDIFSAITDFDFSKTDSLDAKPLIVFRMKCI